MSPEFGFSGLRWNHPHRRREQAPHGAVRDPNGPAYNRVACLPERRKMMQECAEYLEKLKADAEIVPMNQGA